MMVLASAYLRNTMAAITRMGEKSMPPTIRGSRLRIQVNTEQGVLLDEHLHILGNIHEKSDDLVLVKS